jgi:lactate racemase
MFVRPEDAIAACPPPPGRVGIAIPDGTRPVDTGAALRALREQVSGDPPVVVGLGLHRKMSNAELPESPFPLLQHDPDDTVPTGHFSGVPGGIYRPLADCDVLLSVGVVELHQYAGFSGGHKGVSVGCGARATLDALHHRDRVTAPGVDIGRIDGNPFREIVDLLGEAARCRWALVQTERGWLAGEPRQVLRGAAAALDCWEEHYQRYPAMILDVPARKAVNFYQASRAATYVGRSPAPPLLPGATLFLDAECPEGMGEGSGELAFAEVLRRGRSPWPELLSGEAPVGAGTQRAVMLALVLRDYPLVICGLRDPEPLRRCGLNATTLPAAALAPPGAYRLRDPFHRLPVLAGGHRVP